MHPQAFIGPPLLQGIPPHRPDYMFQVNSWLETVRDERLPKDRRVRACDEIQTLLLQIQDVRNLPGGMEAAMSLAQLHLEPVLQQRQSHMDVRTAAASTIGSVGALCGYRFTEFVDWLLKAMESSKHSQPKGGRTELEAFKSLRQRFFDLHDDAASMAMGEVYNLLNANSKAELLEVLLDLALVFFDHYPHIFERFFTDTMDIVTGWLVDIEQAASTRAVCVRTVHRLRPALLADWPFARRLASQLAEDAHGFALDALAGADAAAKADGAAPDAAQCLKRSAAMLRAHSILIGVLADSFDGSRDADVEFLRSIGCSLCKCAAAAVRSHVYEVHSYLGVLASAAEALCDAGRADANLAEGFVPSLLQCIGVMAGAEHVLYLNVPAVAEAIQLISTLITSNPAVLANHVDAALAFLEPLRFHRSKQISTLVSAIMHEMHAPREIVLLRAVYTRTLDQLRGALCTLASDADCAATLPADWARVERSDLADTSLTALFLLSCLSEVGKARNSLIAMHGLNPNLFDFFTKQCDGLLSSHAFATRLPAVHYSMLYVLHQHCSVHDQYVSTSEWFCESTQLKTSTSTYLTTLVQLLQLACCRLHQANANTRALLIEWSTCLLEKLVPYKPDVLRDPGSTSGAVVTRMIVDMLTLCTVEPDSIGANALSKVINSARHSAAACDEIPPLLLAHFCMAPSDETALGTWIGDVSGVNLEQCVSAPRFAALVDYVLSGKHFGHLEEDSDNLNMASATLSLYRTSTCPNSPQNKQKNNWTWAAWQIALFIVNNKLKTTLGDPNKTFGALEQAVRTLAQESVKAVADGSVKTSDMDGNDVLFLQHWHRARLLCLSLEFMDRLIFNAYDGCAAALPPAVQSYRRLKKNLPLSEPTTSTIHLQFDMHIRLATVRTFFSASTNQASCRAWLQRVRLAAATVAVRCQSFELAVRLFTEFAIDLIDKKLSVTGSVLDSFACVCAEAMLRLGEQQALMGLAVWTRRAASANGTAVANRFGFLECVADMAAAKYEQARTGLLLHRKTLCSLALEASEKNGTSNTGRANTVLIDFVTDRLVECCAALRDWSPGMLPDVDQVLPARSTLYLHRLASFEPDCSNVPDKPVSANLQWDLYDSLIVDEINLTNSALSRGKILNRLSNTERCMNMVMDEDTDNLSRVKCLVLGRIVAAQKGNENIDWSQTGHSLLQRARMGDRPDLCVTLSQALSAWHRAREPSAGVPSAQNAAFMYRSRLMRKTGNMGAALAHLDLAGVNGNLAPAMVAKLTEMAALGVNVLPVARHAAKLLMGQKENAHGFALLAASVTNTLDAAAAHGSEAANLDASFFSRLRSCGSASGADWPSVSRALLSLALWLRSEPALGAHLFDENNPDNAFVRLLEEQLMLAEAWLGALDSESVVGALLALAAQFCADYTKAQRALADWAYRAGRKKIEGTQRDEYVLLTNRELQDIAVSLPPDAAPDTQKAVVNLVASLKTDEGGIKTAEELYMALQQTCPSLVAPESLVNIWQRANDRLFLFYESAGEAYFTYLKYTADTTHSGSVTATLRLLRLLARHATQMQPRWVAHFAHADTRPWIRSLHCDWLIPEPVDNDTECQLSTVNTLLSNLVRVAEILPQLFARLSHPSALVRDTLCTLLERVPPDQLVFPAVVGCAGGVALASEDDPVNDNQSLATEERMRASCERVTAVLSKNNPQLVSDVRVFVSELRRVALLHDEKWQHTLAHLQHDMNKRLKYLQDEKARIEALNDLNEQQKAEKYRTIEHITTAMTYKLLNDLASRTLDTAPEQRTPHESKFIQSHGTSIRAALHLATSGAGGTATRLWQPFGQLATSLSNRLARRHGGRLHMSDISPWLSTLAGSCVPLPAHDAPPGVTVQGTLDMVLVLPTKTRPKKLVFVGSDGKQYSFLLKGLEDLHLDERIMQFIQVSNVMLTEKPAPGAPYSARHYRVTALGARAGLIRWVQNALPLFTMYRRWHCRKTNDQPLRPSELFYSKLKPKLHELGIRDNENRSKWPTDVLKQVLAELMTETPKDLLAKELWCGSPSPGSWWRRTRRFARSVAVASALGHVIGLGDRHLDNLLLDVRTGDCVHIDYNVCFERGAQLRVPETVPFRLTQNIRTALGPTDTEGIFRSSCERTLSVMRAERETLLTLLEAFVYDPLVPLPDPGTFQGLVARPQVDWTSSPAGQHAADVAPHPAVMLTVYDKHRSDDGSVESLWIALARRSLAIRTEDVRRDAPKNQAALASATRTLSSTLALAAVARGRLEVLHSNARNLLQLIAVAQADGLETIDHQKLLSDTEVEQAELENAIVMYEPLVKSQVADVRREWLQHQQLTAGVRHALKAVALGLGLLPGLRPLEEDVRRALAVTDTLERVLTQLQMGLGGIDWMYEGMLKLVEDDQQNIDESGDDDITKGINALAVFDGGGKGGDAKPVDEEHEERNAHALQVWKRVRAKLDGRERDSAKRMNVAEQVEWLISEATSSSNLSRMYEGWTSWV